jgi:hypothetical protein
MKIIESDGERFELIAIRKYPDSPLDDYYVRVREDKKDGKVLDISVTHLELFSAKVKKH